MKHLLDERKRIEGLMAEAVAGAHQRDLEVQAKYGVTMQRYWFDERAGKIFCLSEAPSKEAAARFTARRTACSSTRSPR